METFPLRNVNGEVYAFEIPSSYFMSSRAVARFFSRCPGAIVEDVRGFFEIGNDMHVRFSLNAMALT